MIFFFSRGLNYNFITSAEIKIRPKPYIQCLYQSANEWILFQDLKFFHEFKNIVTMKINLN